MFKGLLGGLAGGASSLNSDTLVLGVGVVRNDAEFPRAM
jgi:hypothetical protein